jgi:FPC/CPF motif-containing protein YcgG
MLYGLQNFCGFPTSDPRPNIRALSPDLWFFSAAQQMLKTIEGRPTFPCSFAVSAAEKGALLFSDVPNASPVEASTFVTDLREFISFYKALPHRSALITFVNTKGSRSLSEDEEVFWKILRYLETQSTKPTHPDYSKPDWHFAFDNEELFFNGHSPHYLHRLSRRSPLCLSIITQTRYNLRHISGDAPAAASVAAQIRRVVDAYDRIPRSPYLSVNFDWRQFWLLDNNEPDMRVCPLAVKSET